MNKRQNALWNCGNPSQGKAERILCICSAGLLRSPTLAGELYKRGYNTRAAGVHDYALIQVDEVLLEWADTLFFVQPSLMESVKALPRHRVIVVNIPDRYEYREEELVLFINAELDRLGY